MSDWRDSAACLGAKDPDVFFMPNHREGPRQRQRRHEYALSFCRVCAVRARCADDAAAFSGGYGIWGGMTEEERAVAAGIVPPADQRPAKAPPTPHTDCGKMPGYRRHCRLSEEPCPECKAAKAKESRNHRALRRAQQQQPQDPPPEMPVAPPTTRRKVA